MRDIVLLPQKTEQHGLGVIGRGVCGFMPHRIRYIVQFHNSVALARWCLDWQVSIVISIHKGCEDLLVRRPASSSLWLRRTVPSFHATKDCPTCQERREHYQAVGLVVFCFTIVSFGLLAPITLPLTICLVISSLRRCKNCRSTIEKWSIDRIDRAERFPCQ